jgi:hypothetical protein
MCDGRCGGVGRRAPPPPPAVLPVLSAHWSRCLSKENLLKSIASSALGVGGA